jgi:hypothetical protein
MWGDDELRFVDRHHCAGHDAPGEDQHATDILCRDRHCRGVFNDDRGVESDHDSQHDHRRKAQRPGPSKPFP